MSTKRSAPTPHEQESLHALSQAREQVAVLCVLVDRMSAALQRADVDAVDELGVEVGPTAAKLAADFRTNIWTVESVGGAR